MPSRHSLRPLLFLSMLAGIGCDVRAPIAAPPAPVPTTTPAVVETTAVQADAQPEPETPAAETPAAVPGLDFEFKPPALLVGDPAPVFQVGTWLKGEPVTELAADKTYILECWATWCGPCIQAMPHVTELQAKYKDSLTVIGVNLRERPLPPKKGAEAEYDAAEAAEAMEKKIVNFVEKNDAKMGYCVVRDDVSSRKEGEIEMNWMRPAGQRGIPCTFVVHQGKIAWIGHPMALDPVVEKIVAGKWDFAQARTEHLAEMEREAKIEMIQQKIAELVEAKDIPGVNALLDLIAAVEPSAAKNVEVMRFMTLIEMDEADAAYAMADKLFATYEKEPQALNQIAWAVLDHKKLTKRDFDLALKFAQKANESTGGKVPAILDTLARAYFEKGQIDKAIETQQIAVEYAPEAKSLERALEKYKAAKGE